MRSPRWLPILPLAVGLSAPGHLLAQKPSAVESTTVVLTAGTAQVTLPPDWATVVLSLETRDSSAARASATNGRRLQQLVDTLNRTIGPGDSVRITSLDISSAEDYERRQIVGYDAGARVEVTLRNLDRLASVLDAAFARGATTTRDGVEFKSNRAEAAKRQALAQAFGDARLKAEALAQAAGLTLGPLVHVTTEPSESAYRGPALGAITVTVQSTSLTPSNVVVQAYVQASWRLRVP
jgi:uncharacterized protein YggE